MGGLPGGQVTFVFTDIEGSTRLHHELADGFVRLISEHDELVARVVRSHGGSVVKSMGDGMFAAFADGSHALAAVAELQAAIRRHRWPRSVELRVRVGLHTGWAEPRTGDYVALAVSQAARVCSAAHGGQIVFTDAVLAHASGRSDVVELGAHRLKDFPDPVKLYQLGVQRFPPLRTVAVSNLPRPVSTFVGRQGDIEQVVESVRSGARLLTLVGPGGVGKTRLGIEAAWRLLSEYSDGVFWIDLTEVRDPAQVLPAVAATLGATASVEERIGERSLLMVLDNLEQVVSAAPLLVNLVESCPNLRLLLTSRERLNVRGELVYPVKPLGESDASALFQERAGLLPSEEVRRLCEALDRLPLGVELAAARARVLSVEQILDRLGSRLDSLKGGRDLYPRQRTLRDAIAWSYDLLTVDERQAFGRLSVFAGGCSVEAAEEVTDADIADLQSLVDKSLLQLDANRFMFLETIREYAAERFIETSDALATRRRHAAWCVNLVRAAQPHLQTSAQEHWLGVLRTESDNIAVALAFALEEPVPGIFQAANGLLTPWRASGRLPALISWYRKALAQSAPTDLALRAQTLRAFGTALGYANDIDEAEHTLEQALADYRQLADRRGEAVTLNQLGSIAWATGDSGRSTGLRTMALDIFRQLDDKYGEARSLHLIGEELRDSGRFAEGAEALEQAIAIETELGNTRGVMGSLHSLADLHLDAHETRRASDLFHRALALCHRLGDELSQAYCLAGIACLAALDGDPAAAGRLWGAAEAVEARLNQPMLQKERRRYEQRLAPLEADVHFRAARKEGRGAPISDIVKPLLDNAQ